MLYLWMQIKKNLKSIDSDMEAVDDAVEDIAHRLSKEKANGNDKPIATEKSLDPVVVAKNDQSE